MRWGDASRHSDVGFQAECSIPSGLGGDNNNAFLKVRELVYGKKAMRLLILGLVGVACCAQQPIRYTHGTVQRGVVATWVQPRARHCRFRLRPWVGIGQRSPEWNHHAVFSDLRFRQPGERRNAFHRYVGHQRTERPAVNVTGTDDPIGCRTPGQGAECESQALIFRSSGLKLRALNT